jgi:hypothetical protein
MRITVILHPGFEIVSAANVEFARHGVRQLVNTANGFHCFTPQADYIKKRHELQALVKGQETNADECKRVSGRMSYPLKCKASERMKI